MCFLFVKLAANSGNKMTRYTLLFTMALLFFSCSEKARNIATGETKIIAATVQAPSGNTTIPFHGFWAAETYISTLKQTKSPRRSQDDGEFFVIPKLYKERAYPCTYHDGGADFHIINSNGSFYLRADAGENNLSKIDFSDNGTKLKIWGKTYIRMPGDKGLPEKMLFEGKYMLGSIPVTLGANGTLSGLDNYKFYTVENDYIGAGMGDVDIVYLGSKKDEKKLTHCFEFKADSLLIYGIDCKETDDNGNCMDIKQGVLKWALVKQ